ncbi:uridine diphosphate-N-acetylglucosamine-binding protein YvcK [Acaricomes phytoseiuli]|uniref:gluconeogenesis factor YvcK family protein n=1 Tax=Acaricomes phytoseiuli TaxID=291968 RepID=UPI000368AF27|nr:uridine diphosphate-N-acetylglucosamine-binding protein YvcK [Acaricomes phytoseiuli]MCW1250356.1 uridine diphosphate-N-acetylglucosamine-binding protein YvcK [Acaricomes phytoseiuli]
MGVLTGPLPLIPPKNQPSGTPDLRVVALGGGHGLSASLSALRLLTSELTAVVTVADDGGSSGRLRDEFNVLPPGDLRMALSALCDDTEWGRTWRDVMQHRFQSVQGKESLLDQHAMGNLLIVTLWELLGDTVGGLKWAGALLGARGQVLPMASVPLTIQGTSRSLQEDGTEWIQQIEGQAVLATAGNVEDVRLLPEGAPACVEALEAIELSDWVILGPGSWYTSVLPHLLLPELRQALCTSPARRCLAMNLDVNDKEVRGMSAADHLRVISRYAPEFGVDIVLADPTSIGSTQEARAEFEQAAAALGAEVVLSRVRVSNRQSVHDPLRLAAAFHDVFGGG